LSRKQLHVRVAFLELPQKEVPSTFGSNQRKLINTILPPSQPSTCFGILSSSGYFNLDPHRVLDVILDVFIANVSRHYPFFLELLKSSPWSSKKEDTLNQHDDATSFEKAVGTSKCAQILGYKFTLYQVSHARPTLFFLTC